MEVISPKPQWLPDGCYAEFENPSLIVLPQVRKMAERLGFSPEMQGYWEGAPGARIAKLPQELWHLAECAEIGRTGQNLEGGIGQVGGDPTEMLRPRSERVDEARRVAALARDLRQAISGTRFDQTAGMLRILAGIPAPDSASRADGPLARDILESLIIYARHAEAQMPEEPVFNRVKSGGQLENFLFATVYFFHSGHLGLSVTASTNAAANVASVVLNREVDRDEIRDAVKNRAT